VHLSEPAWQAYRKRISPRARDLPAYRNPNRRPKPSNIIDYLKFDVAVTERHRVLVQLEQAFPERAGVHDLDEDLVRPWDDARRHANRDKTDNHDRRLYTVLKKLSRDIDLLYTRWTESLSRENEYTAVTRDAAERAQRIAPPSDNDGDGDRAAQQQQQLHPMLHTWRHSREDWLRLLASYTYKRYSHSSFAMHAFGETLCRIKTDGAPSRTVTNEMLGCYRVNQKIVSQLTAQAAVASGAAEDAADDAEGDEQRGTVWEDEFEGQEAIEAMVQVMHVPGGYYDYDDGRSVE
jgi:hypothetical protein